MHTAQRLCPIVVALVAAMALWAPAALAQTGPDSVVGSGSGQYFGETIALSVNAPGSVTASRSGTQIFSGPVVSLQVTGASATLEARDASGASLLLLVDDRPGGDHIMLSCTAPGCFPPPFFDFTLTSGDIVVHDAPPLPLSKDDCKKGGWRNFPGFKNQGECIRAVRRQPPSADAAVGDVFGNPQRVDHFVFDARSGPSGERASGTVTWFERAFNAGGPVTCLNVTGNRATIGFENRLPDPGALNGFVFVEDNGTPGVGQDNVRGQLIPGPAPTSCPRNTAVYSFFDEVTAGELTVRDGQPLRTIREDGGLSSTW
jgi:hypothetical protein